MTTFQSRKRKNDTNENKDLVIEINYSVINLITTYDHTHTHVVSIIGHFHVVTNVLPVVFFFYFFPFTWRCIVSLRKTHSEKCESDRE